MNKISIPLLAALLSGCVIYVPLSALRNVMNTRFPKAICLPLVNAGFGIPTVLSGSSLHRAIAGN